MARRKDTLRIHSRRHPLACAWLGSERNGVSVLVWTAEEDVLQNHEGPTDASGPWRCSRSAHNLKPTWQATRVIAYTDRDLCRTGLG